MAMDASILASKTAAAMSTNALPGQQQHTIPPASGHSGIIASAKTQREPWPQSAYPEPLSNGHVRGPAASPSKSRIDARPPPSRGHKRSATGEIKTSVYENQDRSTRPSNGTNGHSRTTSLDSTGNKIAELSAQLRARLSYAAAKVEQSRQIRPHGESATAQGSISGVHFTTQPVQESRQLDNGSSRTSQYHVTNSNVNGSINQAGANAATQSSSLSQGPRLAPPVDIVTGDSLKTARRRPNPNEADGLASHTSTPRHRRHHSEQEGKTILTSGSRLTGAPDATPMRLKGNVRALIPLMSSNGSPVKRRTPSQNALMEKDAIETLLFMSSPENSGYHSSSRARKPSMSVSIEAQMAASTQNSSQGSNTSAVRQMATFNFLDSDVMRTAAPVTMAGHHFVGLEAQAGDEIDRLLDQMEVDKGSEAESRLLPYDFDLGVGGQSGSYDFGGANR